MTSEAKRDVRVSVGENTVVIGPDRFEISDDGKTVTAYTDKPVRTKNVATSSSARNGRGDCIITNNFRGWYRLVAVSPPFKCPQLFGG